MYVWMLKESGSRHCYIYEHWIKSTVFSTRTVHVLIRYTIRKEGLIDWLTVHVQCTVDFSILVLYTGTVHDGLRSERRRLDNDDADRFWTQAASIQVGSRTNSSQYNNTWRLWAKKEAPKVRDEWKAVQLLQYQSKSLLTIPVPLNHSLLFWSLQYSPCFGIEGGNARSRASHQVCQTRR